MLGAYITDYIDWRWVFYINLPLGIAALILVALFYKESLEHTKQQIDWWGASTLVGAIVCLMFALELGGNEYAWDSSVIMSLFAGFAVLTIGFLFVETKAADPVISFSMFRNRLFAASNLIGFFYGAAFIVATIYIPIFIQGVMGGTATNSGLLLLPMMLGTVVSASLGGILISKTSYRSVMVVAAAVLVFGIYMLSTITVDTSRLTLTLYMILVGLGTGASFSVLPSAGIHYLEVRQRGSANSTMAFLRSLGMTLGITVFGIVQRNLLTDKLAGVFAGMGGQAPQGALDSRKLLSPEARAQMPAPVLEKITDALSSSIAQTFLWAMIPAVLALGFVFMMRGERLDATSQDAAARGGH